MMIVQSVSVKMSKDKKSKNNKKKIIQIISPNYQSKIRKTIFDKLIYFQFFHTICPSIEPSCTMTLFNRCAFTLWANLNNFVYTRSRAPLIEIFDNNLMTKSIKKQNLWTSIQKQPVHFIHSARSSRNCKIQARHFKTHEQADHLSQERAWFGRFMW